MKPRTPSWVAAATLAASAAAQTPSFTSDSTISMPLSWSEVNGNNNGVLEPGESATIRLDVSFSNQFGTAHFSPPIGTLTSGTIMGLGSGFIDLDGMGGTTGDFQLGNNPPPQTNNGTTGYGVRSGWRIAGNASPGSVNATGTGITQIVFGQFPQPGVANTRNPIVNMYRILWTPSDYSPRTVRFSLQGYEPPVVAGLVLESEHHSFGVFIIPENVSLGSVNIPIVPAPASAAAIAIAPLLVRSRTGTRS